MTSNFKKFLINVIYLFVPSSLPAVLLLKCGNGNMYNLQSWALAVILYFFYIEKCFFSFSVKLI